MKRVGSRWVKTHKKQKTKREMTKEVKEKTGEVERLEGDMKETLETVHEEVAKMKQEHIEKVMELEEKLRETMNKMKDALKEKKKKEKAYTKNVKELRQVERRVGKSVEWRGKVEELQGKVEELEDKVEELEDKVEKLEEERMEEVDPPAGAAPRSTPRRKLGNAATTPRNVANWGDAVCNLLDERFVDCNPLARVAALEKALTMEQEALPEGVDPAATEVAVQTLKRRLVKLLGDSCTEAEALTELLASLPATTVRAALPDVVVDAVTDAAQHKVLKEVQTGIETVTCLNVKNSLKIGRRPWNRMRHLFGFNYKEGKWHRKTVGRNESLFVPMLPEQRNLADAAQSIADDFGCDIGGTGDGTSAHADFMKCLEDDIEYGVRQGKLKVTSGGTVECADGKELIVQVKMDACRLWSKVQQTSVGYVLVNACENPNSPYDTTEVTLFEGDDHWDSVRANAPETLRAINAIAKHNVINLQGLKVCLFACLFVCLLVCLFVCLFVCVCVCECHV
jgi:hypothetical protein